MFLLIFVLGFVVGDTPAWPSFLGGGRSSIDPNRIPIQWDPNTNIAWKSKLPGKGQSSPILWNDHVFVTSIDGSMKDNCQVTSISIEDGKILWTKSFAANQTVRSNYSQSRSAPTPIVDDQRVYAFFETGNLIAITHSGEKVWERLLTEDYGAFESTIGLASSPLQCENKIVVLVDHEGASYLLAVDKVTGETLWKVDRDSRVSYSSPALISIGTEQHIVCSSAGSVDGYSPDTGEKLWSYDDVGGNSQNTPIQFDDGTFLVGAAPGMHNEKEAVASKSNLCMKIVKTDSGYVPKIQWTTEKVMTTFASPIVYKGLAYWITKAGVVYCYDAATGEQKYYKRLKQQCWATPIGIGERIYFFGKDGATTILAAGPEYQLISENQLWDPDETPPSVPGGTRSVGHDHDEIESTASSAPSSGRPGRPVASNPSVAENAKNESPTATTSSDQKTDRRGSPEAREQGENRFAEAVQYGYALSQHGIVIRSGEYVLCIRELNEKQKAEKP